MLNILCTRCKFIIIITTPSKKYSIKAHFVLAKHVFSSLETRKGLESQDQKHLPNFEEFRSELEINMEHYARHHLKWEQQRVTGLEKPVAFPQCSRTPSNSKTSATPSLWDMLTGWWWCSDEPKCLHCYIEGSQILEQSWLVSLKSDLHHTRFPPSFFGLFLNKFCRCSKAKQDVASVIKCSGCRCFTQAGTPQWPSQRCLAWENYRSYSL